MVKFSHKWLCLGIILKGSYLATFSVLLMVIDVFILKTSFGVIFCSYVFLENNPFHLNIHFEFIDIKLGSVVSYDLKFSFISVVIIILSFIFLNSCLLSLFLRLVKDLTVQKQTFGFIEQNLFFPIKMVYLILSNCFLVLSLDLCC